MWHYVYDSNGSLVEVLPNGSEGNGAKRYTYNTAGYLTQVETHNGTGWDVQAEMAYNGLGQRLSMDAAGVIAYYVMDGNRPLTATTGSDTTSYLYGLGVIGEESNAWSYALSDDTNTQRQLTDALGEVTYSARYTPCPLAAMRLGMLREGDALETYGTGDLAFGYPSIALRAGFGGLMDAVTGLLYVGDGKYYDPSTKVPGPSCAQSSATYIAGTIAHEAFHIRHPHSNSLWEEYGASLTGDIVRDEIIRAGKGTSSDMRFQLSVFTVNINNPDRDQLANDLIDWFDHNELDIYFLPKPQGYGYDPLPP